MGSVPLNRGSLDSFEVDLTARLPHTTHTDTDTSFHTTHTDTDGCLSLSLSRKLPHTKSFVLSMNLQEGEAGRERATQMKCGRERGRDGGREGRSSLPPSIPLTFLPPSIHPFLPASLPLTRVRQSRKYSMHALGVCLCRQWRGRIRTHTYT